MCSHFLIAFVRTLIAISDRTSFHKLKSRSWSWSTCSQTPEVDHDCDRLVRKLQKSIKIVIDLFTNSKSRSLFTNVCDCDQIRSESDHELKCPVFATFAVCFYVCKLIYSINVIFKHLFSRFRAHSNDKFSISKKLLHLKWKSGHAFRVSFFYFCYIKIIVSCFVFLLLLQKKLFRASFFYFCYTKKIGFIRFYAKFQTRLRRSSTIYAAVI